MSGRIVEDEDGSAEQQVVEDDSPEQQADETELDGRSFRLQIDPKNGQRSFFAAVDLRRSDDASNGSVEYKAGAKIVHNGVGVGNIIRFVAAGGMGSVYELRLTDGRRAAAKTIRSDVSATERVKLEKAFKREVAIGFSAGRGPQITSVISVLIPLPGIETTIKGLMLLCDYVDGNDLEKATHSGEKKRNGDLVKDYRGKLYSEEGASRWPLASVTLQILLGLHHLHQHSIIHQVGARSASISTTLHISLTSLFVLSKDFKPANLMMCSDGVVKITDFGLAAFSQKCDEDPWTRETKRKRSGEPLGVLCAKFAGGTVDYLSPEQNAELKESEKGDKEGSRLLTVATSDLYQAGMTILEMHAMYLPKIQDSSCASVPFDAAIRCMSRTPKSEVNSFSPQETLRWLQEKVLMMPKLKDKREIIERNIVEKKVDGARLLKWKSEDNGYRDIQHTLCLKNIPSAKQFHNALGWHISKPRCEMNVKVGSLVKACLAVDVRERPATAAKALAILGASISDTGEINDMSRSVGYTELPAAAKEAACEHAEEDVASTLGGLAKRFVLDSAYADALEVCAEWLGVATTQRTRSEALDAYCNLWKRYGDKLPRELDLSRKAHVHWNEGMCRRLSGEEHVIARLAQGLAHAKVMPLLEKIDLAEQRELDGPVLEVLFGVQDPSLETKPAPPGAVGGGLCAARVVAGTSELVSNDRALAKLRTLSLQNCCRVDKGLIPSAIRSCLVLQTLNLSRCNRTGAYTAHTIYLVSQVPPRN